MGSGQFFVPDGRGEVTWFGIFHVAGGVPIDFFACASHCLGGDPFFSSQGIQDGMDQSACFGVASRQFFPRTCVQLTRNEFLECHVTC